MLPLDFPAVINFTTSFRKLRTLSSLTLKNCNIYSNNTRSTKVTAVLTTNTSHRTLSYECDNKNGRRKSNSNHSFLFPPLYFCFVLTFFLKTIAAPEFFIDEIILAESFNKNPFRGGFHG